jgi:hypothetical protein
MAENDLDLDALAAPPRRVKLGGKWWKLPGDMPMELFLRTQTYQARTEAGEDEGQMLVELKDEITGLFRVHHPSFELPAGTGLIQLLKLLGAVYGPGDALGEVTPNRAARRSKTRTASSRPSKARAATSR